jgi:hypothetical protein
VTPPDTRTEIPLVGDELTLLTRSSTCSGRPRVEVRRLSPQQLATPTVPTSDLTLLGLVRHLAAVETGWLVGFGGLPTDLWPDVVRDRTSSSASTRRR